MLHVFDNIDWKKKNVQQTEMHGTNSILLQKRNATEDLAKINLEPKDGFDQKNSGLTKVSIKICLGKTLREQNPSFNLTLHIMSTKSMIDHV